MDRMLTRLGRLTLSNPVVCASGCFGHGYELKEYTDLTKPGAITLKTVTPEPRAGNPPPRIWEVDCGLHSSIGLQNCGNEAFFSTVMPMVLESCAREKIIVSIGAGSIDGYVELAAYVQELYPNGEIAAIEVNASCPNTKAGAGFICQSPELSHRLIEKVRATTRYPVIAKMNTNSDNYCQVAKAMEEGGADALCTSNTPMGMVIDLKTKKPALGNVKGPICGPAIRPFGVMKTWDIYKEISIPIIAGGGIYTTEHALEYLMAGAAALNVASAHFIDPQASVKIVEGLRAYLDRQGIEHVSELTGIAHRS